MKNSKVTLLVIAVVIIVIAVGSFVLMDTGKKDSMSADMDMSGSQSTQSTEAVATNQVKITDYMFSPQTIKVKVGDTVTWTNNDTVKHTVTIDSGDGPKSDLFGKGQTYTYTFKKAGTFTYHCEPHPYMKGTVIVEN